MLRLTDSLSWGDIRAQQSCRCFGCRRLQIQSPVIKRISGNWVRKGFGKLILPNREGNTGPAGPTAQYSIRQIQMFLLYRRKTNNALSKSI